MTRPTTRRIAGRVRGAAIRRLKRLHKSKAGRWVEIVLAFLLGYYVRAGQTLHISAAAALYTLAAFALVVGVQLFVHIGRGKA